MLASRSTKRTTSKGRTAALALGLALATGVPSGAAAAPTIGPLDPVFGAVGPPISLTHLESDTVYGSLSGQGPVKFARTAPPTFGEPNGWFLRVDVQIRNDSDKTVTVDRFALLTDVSGPSGQYLETPQTIAPGATELFKPHDLRGTGKQPTKLTIRAYVVGNPIPKQRTYAISEFNSDTVTDGYRFPARASDMPVGTFWTTGDGHLHSRSQRYAYDFTGLRWDSVNDKWTGYTEKAFADQQQGIPLGSLNDHYVIWGQKVYATADGVIVSCRRSSPDNTPPTTSVGANNLMVDTLNGEFTAYAHFQEDSIPEALCPVEKPIDDDLPYTPTPVAIKAGDFLGLVGNSGPSDGPHLHIHLQDSGPETSSSRVRGLPLNFFDVAVRTYTGYNYETDAPQVSVLGAANSAFLDRFQLILANSCKPVGGPFGWGGSRRCDVSSG